MWIIDTHNPLVLALTLTGCQVVTPIPSPLVVQFLERKWRRQNGQVISDLPANSADHTSFIGSKRSSDRPSQGTLCTSKFPLSSGVSRLLPGFPTNASQADLDFGADC
jgi:hypothetical protein